MTSTNQFLPINRLDCAKITAQLKEMTKDRPKPEDKTTGSELRMELNKLIDIRDFHDKKAATYRSELPEINHGIAMKNEALKIYSTMTSTPSVRSDIEHAERKLESLQYDADQLNRVISRHEAIRDANVCAIEAFDHERLQVLEAREKILAKAGVL